MTRRPPPPSRDFCNFPPGGAHSVRVTAVRLRIDDVELARRCVSGDRSAQRDVFRRHVQRVHGTLYRILGPDPDIDDLIQDAFIEIFRSLGTFRGDALLSTWVDRLTVRVAYGRISRRRAELVHLAVVPNLPSRDASSEDRAVAREAARRLYAIVDKLEPNQRVAYTLHVIDGRPIEEVAAAMDTSVVTTKVRAWRAARYVEKRARHEPLLAEFLQESRRGEST